MMCCATFSTRSNLYSILPEAALFSFVESIQGAPLEIPTGRFCFWELTTRLRQGYGVAGESASPSLRRDRWTRMAGKPRPFDLINRK